METFQFHNPTRVLYGRGLIKDLPGELSRYGARKALVVTEKLLRQIGVAGKVEAALASPDVTVVGVFDQVVPNSELSVVRAGVEMARKVGADLFVAVGGGSTIDTAKAINM